MSDRERTRDSLVLEGHAVSGGITNSNKRESNNSGVEDIQTSSLSLS